MKLIQPNHVIVIEGLEMKNNFSHPLFPLTVMNMKRSRLPSSFEFKVLRYELFYLRSESYQKKNSTANKLVRIQRILSLFSLLWPDKCEIDFDFRNLTLHPVKFSSFRLLDLGYVTSERNNSYRKQSPIEVLSNFEGALVALCTNNCDNVNDCNANHQSSQSKPYPGLWSGKPCDFYANNQFIQWGIVHKIDLEEQMFYILTFKVIESKMNCIVKPIRPELPKELRNLLRIKRSLL